jgi:hypothetical protein
MIVAPGQLRSTASYQSISFLLFCQHALAHLCRPPPPPSMHVMENPCIPVASCVVALWCKNKVGGKVWITEESLYACDNVSIVDLCDLPPCKHLSTYKSWSACHMIVYNLVQLDRAPIRQAKTVRNLSKGQYQFVESTTQQLTPSMAISSVKAVELGPRVLAHLATSQSIREANGV